MKVNDEYVKMNRKEIFRKMRKQTKEFFDIKEFERTTS